MGQLDANLLGCFCLHANIDGRVVAVTGLDDDELGLEARVLRLE